MSWLLIFKRLDRREAALLDQRAKCLGGGDRRRAAERQVAGVGDHVLRRIGRMPADAEREPHRVAASDRAVLAHAVRFFDLAQVRARLAMHRVHEKLLRLLAILPRHHCSPLSRPIKEPDTPIQFIRT